MVIDSQMSVFMGDLIPFFLNQIELCLGQVVLHDCHLIQFIKLSRKYSISVVVMKITQLQPERDVKPKAVMKTVIELMMMMMELHLCCITFQFMQSFRYQHVSRPIPDITESLQCLEFSMFEISLRRNL